jgi:hypothetical protein
MPKISIIARSTSRGRNRETNYRYFREISKFATEVGS